MKSNLQLTTKIRRELGNLVTASGAFPILGDKSHNENEPNVKIILKTKILETVLTKYDYFETLK
jgi:hypothetical protein